MPISNDTNIQAWSESLDHVLKAFEEEGDFSRKFLLNPVLFSLLGDIKNTSILDAGSGTGYLSRMLAKQGANVTGIEPAESLIKYAQQREKIEKLGIEYIQHDLTTWQPINGTFDYVVSNMVFMDIPDYQPAIKNCIDSLKPNGSLIFSILHPCFEESVDWQVEPSVSTTEYFETREVKQFIGYVIHRPLSEYLNFIIEQDCAITKIVEPQLSKELSETYPRQRRDNHVPSFIIIKATKN